MDWSDWYIHACTAVASSIVLLFVNINPASGVDLQAGHHWKSNIVSNKVLDEQSLLPTAHCQF